jgi:hypothetical protein
VRFPKDKTRRVEQSVPGASWAAVEPKNERQLGHVGRLGWVKHVMKLLGAVCGCVEIPRIHVVEIWGG